MDTPKLGPSQLGGDLITEWGGGRGHRLLHGKKWGEAKNKFHKVISSSCITVMVYLGPKKFSARKRSGIWLHIRACVNYEITFAALTTSVVCV